MAGGEIDILVETARMWEDLGFWRTNADDVFHIHGVTGPDEYTTVVNDNLYTNVMARANLAAAASAVDNLQVHEEKSKGVYVKGLSDFYVSSAQEVYEIMRQGGAARVVSYTSKYIDSDTSRIAK